MTSQGTDDAQSPDWRAAEDELLDRAREVARRIVARVKQLTEDTAPSPALKPDEPTGEAPPVG